MNNQFYSQIEIFVEIVRQGSITAAAAELRMSKSNVSQKLAHMEKDLGVQLFTRTTRAMTLTRAGQDIYEPCAKAVDSVSRARSGIGLPRADEPLSGTVNMTGSNIYLTQFIIPKVRRFSQSYPDIKLNIIGSDRAVHQEAENIDLRFRIGPVKADGVRLYHLPALTRVLCCSAELAKTLSGLKHPGDLSTLSMIKREQERGIWHFQNGPESYAHDLGQDLGHADIGVNSYELAVEAVRSGLGLAVLTRGVIETDLQKGALVPLLPDWKITPLPVTLAVRHARLLRPHVRAAAGYFYKALNPVADS